MCIINYDISTKYYVNDVILMGNNYDRTACQRFNMQIKKKCATFFTKFEIIICCATEMMPFHGLLFLLAYVLYAQSHIEDST